MILMNKELLKFLQKTGVDTRFVSIIENKIYINNLKLSRFSRKKEEKILSFYPELEIIRSKIFQKTCIKASRNLAHSIQPREKILLLKNEDPFNHALYIILEPYQRKYGIELIFSDDNNDLNLNVDSVASALTLDHEVLNILNLMLNGDKIKLLSSNNTMNNIKIIYPLISIPKTWIFSWLDDKFPKNIDQENNSQIFLNFLETIIPDIRDNLYKSALFASKKS